MSGGIVPGAVEMMDNLSIRAAEGYTGAGYPTDAGAALVVELDGSEAECETRFDEVVSICEEAGADSIRVAKDDAERTVIWTARKAAFAAMGRIAPNYYVQDSVIPRTRLAEVLGRIEELPRVRPPRRDGQRQRCKACGQPGANGGHATAPNGR